MTDAEARAILERERWPDGVVCPHCSSTRAGKVRSSASRPGVWNCHGCRKQFTVTVKTIMQRSHLPPWKWIRLFELRDSPLSGLSILRELNMGSYKTSWRTLKLIKTVKTLTQTIS